MPPTDEEYLDAARAALIGLVAELDRDLRDGDRGACRRIAADIRMLVSRSERIVQPGAADDLVDMAEAARERVVRDLGTSAWDGPQAAPHLPPLPKAPDSE